MLLHLPLLACLPFHGGGVGGSDWVAMITLTTRLDSAYCFSETANKNVSAGNVAYAREQETLSGTIFPLHLLRNDIS